VNGFSYRGIQTIGSDEDLAELYSAGYREAFISVGYLGKGTVRQTLSQRLADTGFTAVSMIDHSAAVATDAAIGKGVFVGKNAVVGSDASIGDHAIINSGAIVEHECRIGAFSHVAIGAAVSGNVSIGTGCLIGANATLLQGITIGDHVIVGAGAVVTSDVPDEQIAVGVPATMKGR